MPAIASDRYNQRYRDGRRLVATAPAKRSLARSVLLAFRTVALGTGPTQRKANLMGLFFVLAANCEGWPDAVPVGYIDCEERIVRLLLDGLRISFQNESPSPVFSYVQPGSAPEAQAFVEQWMGAKEGGFGDHVEAVCQAVERQKMVMEEGIKAAQARKAARQTNAEPPAAKPDESEHEDPPDRLARFHGRGRGALWLHWYDREGEVGYHSYAEILDRWNALPEEVRQAIDPRRPEKLLGGKGKRRTSAESIRSQIGRERKKGEKP